MKNMKRFIAFALTAALSIAGSFAAFAAEGTSVKQGTDTYRKIIRNGEECWVYDWGKNADINSFNYMLDRWEGTQQQFFINGETKQYFLINKQERTVMEISNPEVIRFLYENLYMANINETFIELFTSIGGFKTVKYE